MKTQAQRITRMHAKIRHVARKRIWDRLTSEKQHEDGLKWMQQCFPKEHVILVTVNPETKQAHITTDVPRHLVGRSMLQLANTILNQ